MSRHDATKKIWDDADPGTIAREIHHPDGTVGIYRKDVDDPGAYNWSENDEYRLFHIAPVDIPKTCYQPRVLLEGRPETEAPERGTEYYVPSPGDPRGYFKCAWLDDEEDKRWLAANMVYLKGEHAAARAKAQSLIEEE